MMYVALTYDHRIVDGAEAVQFLVRVKELVEDPGGAAARMTQGPTSQQVSARRSLEREHSGDPWHGSPLRRHPDGDRPPAGCSRPLRGGAHDLGDRAARHLLEERGRGGSAARRRRRRSKATGRTPPAERRCWRDALDALDRLAAACRPPSRGLPDDALFDRDQRSARRRGIRRHLFPAVAGTCSTTTITSGQIALLENAQP